MKSAPRAAANASPMRRIEDLVVAGVDDEAGRQAARGRVGRLVGPNQTGRDATEFATELP